MTIRDCVFAILQKSTRPIDHIVFNCSRYVVPRTKFIGDIRIHHHRVPESVRDILGSKNLCLMKILYRFLNDISYIV